MKHLFVHSGLLSQTYWPIFKKSCCISLCLIFPCRQTTIVFTTTWGQVGPLNSHCDCILVGCARLSCCMLYEWCNSWNWSWESKGRGRESCSAVDGSNFLHLVIKLGCGIRILVGKRIYFNPEGAETLWGFKSEHPSWLEEVRGWGKIAYERDIALIRNLKSFWLQVGDIFIEYFDATIVCLDLQSEYLKMQILYYFPQQGFTQGNLYLKPS